MSKTKYTPKTNSKQSWYHLDPNCGRIKKEALERSDNYIQFHELNECPICGDGDDQYY